MTIWQFDNFHYNLLIYCVLCSTIKLPNCHIVILLFCNDHNLFLEPFRFPANCHPLPDKKSSKRTEIRRGETGEAFEEAAERGRIGVAEVVTDLLNGEVGTSGEQVLGLRSQILLDIIAGRYTYYLFDDN